MSTFWQLLRVGFWMLPLQRALTVIGALVLVTGLLFDMPFNMPGSTLPLTFFGPALMMLVPLLAGGVFLRMLSSQRALLLRPHARGRLLLGALGILMVATLSWMLCYWITFQRAPVRFRPDAEALLMMFALTLNFGTTCAVALFIASRSPLWTLVILLLWQAPSLLLRAAGVEDASRLIGGPVSLAMSVAAWTIFAIWYLRSRRIHAAAWGRRQSTSAAPLDAGARPAAALTREQAMLRWVLAGASPAVLGLQCGAACLALLTIQWALGREAGVLPMQAMMFGALATAGLVSGAVGSSMARRTRALWLPAGRTRLELHGWIEKRLLGVALAISAAVALAACCAWVLFTQRPSLPPSYLFPALLLPGLCAAWLGLMQQHQRSFFDALAGICIGAGIFYGLVRPLYEGSTAAPWTVLGAEVTLALLLREVARVRWRDADWRRAQQG